MTSFDPTDINRRKESSAERLETANMAGGTAYDPDSPEFELYKLVINNFLEDTYYESGSDSFQRVVGAVDAVARVNPEFVFQMAMHARHVENLRDVSQLLLVLGANWGKRHLASDVAPGARWSVEYRDAPTASPTQAYVREYTPSIIDRMDEFNTVLALQEGLFDSIPPKGLKKGMDDALHVRYVLVKMQDADGETHTERFEYIDDGETEDEMFGALMGLKFGMFDDGDLLEDALDSMEIADSGYKYDDYTSAKYFQRNNEKSLVDVINVVRPTPRSENRDELFRRIALGDKDEYPDVEPLRNERTWEAVRSDDADDRSEEEQWRETLDNMGIFARIRNLRNMLQAGLTGAEVFDYDEDSFEVFGPNSKAVVEGSQLFPFRFYQSYRACKMAGADTWLSSAEDALQIGPGHSTILDVYSAEWLEHAVDHACRNLPESLDGTFVAVDLSGSMFRAISQESTLERVEIGALFGAMMAKRQGDIGVFGDDFAPVQVNNPEDASVLDLAHELIELQDEVGHSTNGWKAIDWLTETMQDYERVVVFTDEQMWDSRPWGSERTLKSAWDEYRAINPDASLYVIDLASYGKPAFPEGYPNVVQVSGWSESVLDYIDALDGADAVIEDIESSVPWVL